MTELPEAEFLTALGIDPKTVEQYSTTIEFEAPRGQVVVRYRAMKLVPYSEAKAALNALENTDVE